MTVQPRVRKARRRFFQDCALGVGAMALGTLLNEGRAATTPKPHFPPKAKSVIYLFMAGGPSQLELFDYKPQLQALHNKPIPDSFIAGKRFAFMSSFTKEKPKVLCTQRKFSRYGEHGTYVSECLPHLGSVADDISIVRSLATNVFNHGPAKFFINTGSPQFGRPSMGSWATYGLGSESKDLPG